ncbi:MAG: hypothetical protein NC313_15075, partial [Butyrivibrio sp.]|nr:hypothetical protein [Butyrivibrio sp.]
IYMARGTWGKNLAEYFDYKGWSFEGFLATTLDGSTERCILFDKADIADDDGIIIAVGTKEAYTAIVAAVKKRCNREQVFP